LLSREVFFVHRLKTLTPLLAALAATGCVAYRTQYASIESAASSVAKPLPDGPLDFETAVSLLVRRHPALRATRAEIAAVNRDPGAAPLFGQMQFMDGRARESMIGTDVLALLGIGPRAARRALARAVQSERVCAHHERARALVGELAEAFAVERVLRDLELPELPVDIGSFESAGLASKSVIAAARAVDAETDAERRIIDAELRSVRHDIAGLVAASPDVDIEVAPAAAEWPVVAPADRRRLVLARGDLQRLLAAWHVADRRYRHAVARQYPNLVLGLGAEVDMDLPMQIVRLELPLDAPAEARAAVHARDAAFHRLDAGVLAALHEAESVQLDYEARAARLDAVAERRRAARALMTAERAHLETDPGGLGRVVLVAGRELDAARQHREAAVAAARARVRAARAAGWPSPAMLGGAR
jgi:hypothetical protein